MSTEFFPVERIPFEGVDSDSVLAFRHYDPDEMLLGKRMEEHLRFSCAYWHSFAWPGGDPFGGQTFDRPWFPDRISDEMEAARLKADVAFEMFTALGLPFFCFHDADVRPEGDTFRESVANLNAIADLFERKMEDAGIGLLWGTANLFSHRLVLKRLVELRHVSFHQEA